MLHLYCFKLYDQRENTDLFNQFLNSQIFLCCPCQFYICYGDTPHLDGQYTIFGQVTEGMELIDDVKNGTVMKKVSVLP